MAKKRTGHGIDYGMGNTNIDRSNGIRYGVIHSGAVCQSWSDSSEAQYGAPSCPKCGAEFPTDYNGPSRADYPAGLTGAKEYVRMLRAYEESTSEYYCPDCQEGAESDSAYPEDAHSWTYDGEGYSCEQSRDDCDIFILRSPYYTRAQFCSPCAPGACYLESPCESGERAYCFGPDWFDSDSPCPYPVYEVATDKLVYTPAADRGADEDEAPEDSAGAE
jgi:ribosomal protein L37AE/L43A